MGLVLLLVLVGLCWADSPVQGQLLSENFPGQILIMEKETDSLITDSNSNPTQVEKVSNQSPIRYRVAPGDSLRQIARRYQLEWSILAKANSLADSNQIRIGQVLVIPKAGTAVAPITQTANPNHYPWPVHGSITQHYGGLHDAFHHGLDIAAPIGTAISAVDGGRITWAGWKSIYGLCVIIDHGQGRKTLYGHASKILVQKGQPVVTGQTIAKVGSTGRSTGPHLHFEIYDQGQTVDPLAFVD